MNRIALALCAFIMCAVAAPAGAAIMVANYSGVFFAGTDESGIFVTPHGSLAGYEFVASFTYDTSLGARTTVPGVSDRQVGGDMLGDATPILSATLSVNGVTYDFMSNYYGEVKTESGLVGHTTSYSSPHLLSQHLTAYSSVSGAPTSLEDSAQDLHTPNNFSRVEFEIFGRASQTDPFTQTLGYTTTGANLTYSVAPLVGGGGNGGGVPEPATWTLLIMGFGLVGVALRRRTALGAPSLAPVALDRGASRSGESGRIRSQATPAMNRLCLAVSGVLVPAAMAAAIAGPATAAVYTYDWHGTVDGSVQGAGIFNKDYTDTFGAGFDLIGQAITVSVKLDTETPGAIYGPLGHSQLSGFGDAVPLSIAITIGGVTYALDEDHFGGGHVVPVETWTPGHGLLTVGDTYEGYPFTAFGRATESLTAVSQIYSRSANSTFLTGDGQHTVYDSVENRFEFFGDGLPAGLGDANLDTPPQSGTWILDPYAVIRGYFVIEEEHDNDLQATVRDIASASFSFNSVTVTSDNSTGPMSPAPEPATWAMMIIGFGLVGGAMRRRTVGRRLVSS